MSETVAVVSASRSNFLIFAPLCVGRSVAMAWQQDQLPALPLHVWKLWPKVKAEIV